MMLNSDIVKRYGIEAGASVVGIASAVSLDSAPEGYRPKDILEGCVSVIVLGIPFTRGSFDDPLLYTEVRSAAIEKIGEIEKATSKMIKKAGFKVKGINCIGGKYIDGITYGTMSLKHAAEAAGLGVIGKNYLLINPEHGTLLWFAAVLTDAPLAPDERMVRDLCAGCSKCADACPSGALDNILKFGKKGCAGRSFKYEDKKWRMDCFLCRRICPHKFGFR